MQYGRSLSTFQYFLNIQSRTVSQVSNMFLRNVGIRVQNYRAAIFIAAAVRILKSL
jgi:hypothetical protein